uniref:Uncharacterized protein n=1 Tax=Oryza barthii TaxID=65489 RepID=A0A0D3F3X9_9ORYZ
MEGRERKGAPVLRWWNGLNGGGQVCSRATRTRGSGRPAKELGEEAGTATAGAWLGQFGRWRWWLSSRWKRWGKGEKWILLDEARLVVRGNWKRSYRGGDRVVVAVAGHGKERGIELYAERGGREEDGRLFIGFGGRFAEEEEKEDTATAVAWGGG